MASLYPTGCKGPGLWFVLDLLLPSGVPLEGHFPSLRLKFIIYKLNWVMTEIDSDFNILSSLLLPHTCCKVSCKERGITLPIKLWSLSGFKGFKFIVHQGSSCIPIRSQIILKKHIMKSNNSLFLLPHFSDNVDQLLLILESHYKEVTTLNPFSYFSQYLLSFKTTCLYYDFDLSF